VVPLTGVSIDAPITRIVSGGRMPMWAVGPAGTGGLLRLGSNPPVKFSWSLNQGSSAEIRSALQPVGVFVSSTDSAVQFFAGKPERVTVLLNVQVI